MSRPAGIRTFVVHCNSGAIICSTALKPLVVIVIVIVESHNYERASFLRACTVYAYNTSLNANKKAAVMTLWVTLGPIPLHN